MTVYAVTVPTFLNESNLQWPAIIGKLTFKFVASWYDNLWHMTILLNNADKRSLIAYPRVVYFLGDDKYSLLFNTSLDAIGYADLSGMKIEVAIID